MLLRSARSRATVVALVILAALLGAVAAAPAAQAASLTGVAFKDFDRDGLWQTSEPLLADQEIHLFAASGPYLARSVTDTFGRYTFSDLADGDYRVDYSPASWWALRQDWVPTTAPSLKPSRSVSVSAATTADFGWRPIVRSTDGNAPISSFTGPSGLRVSSYDDVVPARELHDALATGLLGAEAAATEIRFDLYAGSMTSSSAVQTNGGPYQAYTATCYVSYLSWLDSGDRTLTHEYGHAWSMYNAFVVQQDPSLASYLQARGLAGDPRVNSSYAWQAGEMIAEDYRRLFGSANARTGGQINNEIPAASEVPGLADFLTTTFTTPPASPPPPPPPPPTAPAAPAAPASAAAPASGASRAAADHRARDEPGPRADDRQRIALAVGAGDGDGARPHGAGRARAQPARRLVQASRTGERRLGSQGRRGPARREGHVQAAGRCGRRRRPARDRARELRRGLSVTERARGRRRRRPPLSCVLWCPLCR